MDRRNRPRFVYFHHIRHPGQDKSHQLIEVGVQAAGIEVNDTEPLEPALPAGQGRASSQRRKGGSVSRRTRVQLDASSKDQKSRH